MKLIYSNFDNKTGKSIVTLANKDGIYTGIAKLNPKDNDIASEFMGCNLAESRAWIKYLKAQKKKRRLQLKTIENLIKDFTSVQLYTPEIDKRFKIQIKYYKKDIQEIDESIKSIQDSINRRISARAKIVEKYRTESNNINR